MKLLETRRRASGYTVRRYEAAGERWSTWEVRLSVLKAFGMGRVLRRIEVAQRGADIRIGAAQRKQEIMRLLVAGHKPLAVAHALGVSDSYVRHVRREVTERGPLWRSERQSRRPAIEKLLIKGWKSTAIAHELGVSESYVRAVRVEIRKGVQA